MERLPGRLDANQQKSISNSMCSHAAKSEKSRKGLDGLGGGWYCSFEDLLFFASGAWGAEGGVRM